MKKLTIGQLAKYTGIKVGTIRYYEKCGLISKPSRRESGYREFTHKHIGQINFIKQAKTIGFTLKEILVLLDMAEKKLTKGEIHKFIETKMLESEALISELNEIKQSIKLLLKECLSKKGIYDCTLFVPLKLKQ